MEAAAANDSRSKKQAPKKRGGKGGNQESLVVPQVHVELVRLIRSEPRKADNPEDPGRVQLSKASKATQLQLSEDKMSVTGHKGFRSVRATHGVFTGAWYMEWIVTHMGATGHARFGWCTKKSELQAPVGFDAHGFGFRDVDGSKVHQGKREPYGGPFKEGDIVGMLISMPTGSRPIEIRNKKVVRWKGSMYYEDEPEATPEVALGSSVQFFINGIAYGPAFTDILEGTYYPCASIYTMPEQTEGATVKANFGPIFAHPPLNAGGEPMAKPMSAVPQLEADLTSQAAAATAAAAVKDGNNNQPGAATTAA